MSHDVSAFSPASRFTLAFWASQVKTGKKQHTRKTVSSLSYHFWERKIVANADLSGSDFEDIEETVPCGVTCFSGMQKCVLSSSASGGKNSNITNWTFMGDDPKNLIILNFAKIIFRKESLPKSGDPKMSCQSLLHFSGNFPSKSSGSRVVSISADSRKCTSMAVFSGCKQNACCCNNHRCP